MLVLLARRDVLSIVEQVPVSYYDHYLQKWTTHFFDVVVTMTDGSTGAIAVKPTDYVGNLTPVINTIAEQVANFADWYSIITDGDLPQAKADNAQLILAARRDPDQSADEHVRAIVRTLHSTTTIDPIIAASELKGLAFRSIARLIDLGELEYDTTIRIDYPSVVWRPSQYSNLRAAA